MHLLTFMKFTKLLNISGMLSKINRIFRVNYYLKFIFSEVLQVNLYINKNIYKEFNSLKLFFLHRIFFSRKNCNFR